MADMQCRVCGQDVGDESLDHVRKEHPVEWAQAQALEGAEGKPWRSTHAYKDAAIEQRVVSFEARVRAALDTMVSGCYVPPERSHDGAVACATPFGGEDDHVYLKPDGTVTDGGGTLNHLHALRLYETYMEWPGREEFLDRHSIVQRDGSLVCEDPEDPHALLAYMVGVNEVQREVYAYVDVVKTQRLQAALRQARLRAGLRPEPFDEELANWPRS